MVQSVYSVYEGGDSKYNSNINNVSYEDISNKAIKIIGDMLPHLHSIVIGPGLGRDDRVKAILPLVIAATIERNIPLIIDADAFYFIQQQFNMINLEKQQQHRLSGFSSKSPRRHPGWGNPRRPAMSLLFLLKFVVASFDGIIYIIVNK